MSANPTNGRRSWRPIAIALAIVAAAVIAILAFNGTRNQNSPDPTATPTTAPSVSPTQGPDAAPTGCLGGPGRDADMLLSAVDAAPQTTYGAVEVSAAFVRWLNRFPYPDSEESQWVQDEGIASNSPMRDLEGFFADEPNLSGGLVSDGSDYHLSTVGGVYLVESESDDSVTSSIGTTLVEDGALSPMLKGSITVTVAWEDGNWKFVSSEGTRTTEELFAVGEPFAEGC